jgi:hypothetical protein
MTIVSGDEESCGYDQLWDRVCSQTSISSCKVWLAIFPSIFLQVCSRQAAAPKLRTSRRAKSSHTRGRGNSQIQVSRGGKESHGYPRVPAPRSSSAHPLSPNPTNMKAYTHPRTRPTSRSYLNNSTYQYLPLKCLSGARLVQNSKEYEEGNHNNNNNQRPRTAPHR